MIVGTVAIKGPTPAAIRAAQNELQLAIERFDYAVVHPVCRSGLVRILILYTFLCLVLTPCIENIAPFA